MSGRHSGSTIQIIPHSEPRSGDSRKRTSESSTKDTDEKACVANPRESGKDNARDGRSGLERKTHEDEWIKCARCGQTGHMTREYYAKSTLDGVTHEGCYMCGEQGHFRRDCPEMKGQEARGRAFELNAGKARDELAIVTEICLEDKRKFIEVP
ncbi:cellular nucleic acid-binding protein-like [Helianthus annuus]|uniref:cellular nucleic acid-binding protein-like n=1 Tax=Helianthus annuus TaxID=4232 RepID=UPI000B905E89|nr:cellular nucleic acid-binding protein-like [Helianthus annuus]